jgi:hypothetical protein
MCVTTPAIWAGESGSTALSQPVELRKTTGEPPNHVAIDGSRAWCAGPSPLFLRFVSDYDNGLSSQEIRRICASPSPIWWLPRESRAIAQAVGLWLPTAAARVQTQV